MPTTQPTQLFAPHDAARLLLENRPTTQPTQVVASQDAIPVTVATPVPFWTANPNRIQRLGFPNNSEGLIELFTHRAFFPRKSRPHTARNFGFR